MLLWACGSFSGLDSSSIVLVLQMLQRHWPWESFLGFVVRHHARGSEKKRSPLSSGSFSTHLNGMLLGDIPASIAI